MNIHNIEPDNKWNNFHIEINRLDLEFKGKTEVVLE